MKLNSKGMVLGAALLVGAAVVAVAQSGKLVYNSNQSDPTARTFDTRIVELFKKKYPNVDMEFNTVDHETFQDTSVRTYLASDNPPDVLTWFAGNRMRAFSDKGLAANISSVWKDNGWEKAYPKGFQSLAKDTNGNYVFVPTSYYWWAVYYRKDIFQKLGLKEPKTWTEFLAVCEALKKGGITPIGNAAKATWPQGGWFDFMNMRTNGPQFHKDLTDGKIPYTDPRVKKTMTNWKVLVDKGYLLENAASYTWEDAANLMVQGKVGMYLMGDFVRGQYPDEKEAKELDFFRFPIIDPKLPIGEEAPTDGFFMPAKAKNVDNAKLFLSFLGSKEVAELAVKENNLLSTRNDVDPKLYEAKPQIAKAQKTIINEADQIMQFYDRDTAPEMARIGMDGFVKFLSNPTQIDSILTELETARKRIFNVK
jgi:ABC-type glycerol-3-phosphate transport system substrate-binding protein